MKHIFKFFTLFLLLCGTILLSDAVYMSEQQPFNPIVSSGLTISDHRGSAQYTAGSSIPVSFSIKHKTYHHTPVPCYNLNSMNAAQLEQYFVQHGYTEDDILQRQDLFLSADYLALAKKLPKYAEYVTRHYHEYRKFNWYTKFVGRLFYFYTAGFQDTFTRLYRECEEERLAQERREQKQRALKAQQEREIRAQQQQKADAYCAKIDAVQHDDEMIQAIPVHHKQCRHTAYARIKTATLDTVTRNYIVESDTVTFAQEYDIAETDLIMLRGNAYEHQLHSEFLEQLHEIHTISTYYALQPNNLLIDAIGHGVAIGMEANRLQQPETATTWANFGWKTLEVIHSTGEGLLLWAENTAHMIMDPVNTVGNILYGLGMLIYGGAYALGCTARTAIKLNALKDLEDYEAYAHEITHINNNITALQTYCTDKLAAVSTEDLIKHGTVLAADIVLTPKILMFGGTLCARTVPLIRDVLVHIKSRMPHIKDAITRAFEVARTESPVLQTAEGILMKVSEGLDKVGGTAGGIIKASRTALETMHAQYMAHLEMELGALQSLFDNKIKGFAEFANKFIKIEYKHILGMNLVFDAQGRASFSGFHHDLMNVIEKSGLIEFANKVTYSNGFYSADLIIDGMKVPKTFFPPEWPRKKVIEKIYEAYHNFIKSGVIPKPRSNEKYLISGIIEEGINIEMWVTKKGKIVTAYPLLK